MISAWATLAGVILLIVSGWGITQTGVIYSLSFGLIDRRLANAIHRATNVPLAFFFLAHVLINIKLRLGKNYSSWSWLINTLLFVMGAGVMAIAIYMEYFRLGG
jgi:succinate dehydrogenase/fumarate reductase cytochrome b subunit